MSLQFRDRCTVLYNLGMISGCNVSTLMFFSLFFCFLILVIKLDPDLNQSVGSDGRDVLSISDRKVSNLFVDRY